MDWITLRYCRPTYFPAYNRDNFGHPWAFLQYNYLVEHRRSHRARPARAGPIPSPAACEVWTVGGYFNRPDRTNFYLGYPHDRSAAGAGGHAPSVTYISAPSTPPRPAAPTISVPAKPSPTPCCSRGWDRTYRSVSAYRLQRLTEQLRRIVQHHPQSGAIQPRDGSDRIVGYQDAGCSINCELLNDSMSWLTRIRLASRWTPPLWALL